MMKWNKIILSVILSISFGGFFGVSTVQAQGIESIEKKVQSLIEEMKLSSLEKCRLYQLAARELYLFNYLEKSKEYYQKLLKEGCQEAEAEAALNILTINKLQKKELKADEYKKLKKLLKEKGYLKKTLIKDYLAGLEGATEYSGYFGTFHRDRDLKKEMEKKNYKKALLLISPTELIEGNINLKIQYDILSSVIYGKKNKKLFCEEDLKKYSHSLSYTMDICRYLKDYISGRARALTLKSLQEKAKRESPHYLYYIQALKELP